MMFKHVTVLGLVASAAFVASQPAGDASARKIEPKQPVQDAPKQGGGSFARDDSAAEKLGWRLGMQAWTFRDRSTQEAIQTTQRLGVKYMQIYAGQTLQKSNPDVKVGVDMTAEQRELLKKMLADAGVTALSLGVVGFKNDEADARKTFEFAKAMGLENIATEPDPDAWPLLAKLADEYGINIACHNHPKPSRYWNPDTVLESVKPYGKRIGVCADTGHWKRSGLEPMAGLATLSGRILELHFKDIDNDQDQPWGTGKCDARGMLKALHAQGFKGPIYVEYEHGSGAELDANVEKSIRFFDSVASDLAGKAGK